MPSKAKSSSKSSKSSRSKASGALELRLKTVGWILLLGFGVLLGWIMLLLEASLLVVVTVYVLVLLPFGLWLSWFYLQVTKPWYRLTSLVEAIRLEDYSLRASVPYRQGIVHDLYKEISALAEELQQRKQVYDQHTLLIYHLIEQLDTPIAVFNHQLQLSHANAAFSTHLKQPWQTMRHYGAGRLGLVLDKQGQWTLSEPGEDQRWQVRQSHFIEHGQPYHLVILINIENALRQQQQQSWQQIIRVLSHEIRNSLTPIKSLAQSLVEHLDVDERSHQALNVIVDRSVALQAFVNRYGSIGKPLTLQCRWFSSQWLEQQLSTLLTSHTLVVDNQVDRIWADPVLLEQALINLLKNAAQASESGESITLSFKYQEQQYKKQLVIEIKDRGQGIANPQNLFIPFYTTKPGGSGIGLGLCRNIVEHHGGRLSLVNNSDGVGALASVVLPANG